MQNGLYIPLSSPQHFHANCQLCTATPLPDVNNWFWQSTDGDSHVNMCKICSESSDEEVSITGVFEFDDATQEELAAHLVTVHHSIHKLLNSEDICAGAPSGLAVPPSY